MNVTPALDPVVEPAPEWHHDRLGMALWVATLIWVVGMPTIFPIGNDALEAVSVFTFDRIGFLIAAGLFTVIVSRDPRMLRQVGRVELLMALYLAIAVLSWLTTLSGKPAVDLKRDINLLLTAFVMPYTAFVIARHGRWTRPQTTVSFTLVAVAIGLFLIAIGLVQGLVDWRFLVAEADQAVHRSRARGPFANAVPYALILSTLVPIAVGVYAHAVQRRRRVLLFCVCAGLIEGLILAQTRVVWLAVPAALAYFAAVCPPARRPALAMAAGLVAALVLAAAGVDHRLIASANGAASSPRGTIGERIQQAEPMYHRVAVWGTALNMIGHRPVFGFGFGARTFVASREGYYASCCGVAPEWAIPCAVPHNEALNVLVLLGVAGLVIYVGLLWSLWRLLSAHAADSRSLHATLAIGVQVAFVILVFCAQMHDVMYYAALQVLFFFLAGLATPAARSVGATRGAVLGAEG